MVFQQVVPPPIVQDILHSRHSEHTSAHVGFTKILEKASSRFYWPFHKRDVEVVFASCLVCKKRNSFSKKQIHSLWAWQPSFLFSTVGFDLISPPPLPSGNRYNRWSNHQVASSSDATRSVSFNNHWSLRGSLDNSLWLTGKPSLRPRT